MKNPVLFETQKNIIEIIRTVLDGFHRDGQHEELVSNFDNLACPVNNRKPTILQQLYSNQISQTSPLFWCKTQFLLQPWNHFMKRYLLS